MICAGIGGGLLVRVHGLQPSHRPPRVSDSAESDTQVLKTSLRRPIHQKRTNEPQKQHFTCPFLPNRTHKHLNPHYECPILQNRTLFVGLPPPSLLHQWHDDAHNTTQHTADRPRNPEHLHPRVNITARHAKKKHKQRDNSR